MKRRIWRLIGYVLCSLFIGTYPASHYASPVDAAPRNAVPGDEDCYVEIASIDFGDGSEKLENNRFRHVFQYIDTYPYYRRFSDVYVGIETVRYFPNSIRPNRNYWSIVDGRMGVGAEGITRSSRTSAVRRMSWASRSVSMWPTSLRSSSTTGTATQTPVITRTARGRACST